MAGPKSRGWRCHVASFLATTQEGAVAAPRVPSPPLSGWRPPRVPASLSWGYWCNWFGQHAGWSGCQTALLQPGAAPAGPQGTAAAGPQHLTPPWALCRARLGRVGEGAGVHGQRAPCWHSYRTSGASARPSGRMEVLYVRLQPHVHGVSVRHHPGHRHVLHTGFQGSRVLAEK